MSANESTATVIEPNDIHVAPFGETGHTETQDCKCEPVLGNYGTTTLIVHRRFKPLED